MSFTSARHNSVKYLVRQFYDFIPLTNWEETVVPNRRWARWKKNIFFTILSSKSGQDTQKTANFEFALIRFTSSSRGEHCRVFWWLIVFLHWGVIPIPAQPWTNVAGQKLAKYDMKFVDWKSNLFRISAATHDYRAVEFEYTTYAVFAIQRLQF